MFKRIKRNDKITKKRAKAAEEAAKQAEKEKNIEEKIKVVSNEPDKCPYCNSEDISYNGMDFPDNSTYYACCTCKVCNKDFEEWYQLNFLGHKVGSNGEYEASEMIDKEIEYKNKKY